MAVLEAPVAHQFTFEDGYESLDTQRFDLEIGQVGVYKFRMWDTWTLTERDGSEKVIRVVVLQDLATEINYHAGSYDLVSGFRSLELAPGRIVQITRLADKDTGAPAGMKCYRIQPAKL